VNESNLVVTVEKDRVGEKLIIATPDQATVHIQLRADHILVVDKREKFQDHRHGESAG
jgi:hypothetical protein